MIALAKLGPPSQQRASGVLRNHKRPPMRLEPGPNVGN